MSTEAPVSSAGPFIVPPFERDTGGVDFLGLRQANLDLMGECLPGINNATYYVRPFSLLSWVHWKFHQEAAKTGGREIAKSSARRFLEKAEILFTWGHQLANESVPGRNAKCPGGQGGWTELTFRAWGRSRSNTSLQAAVLYGPAMKSGHGLGFADPVDEETHRVTTRGAALAEALDRKLSKTGAYDLLASLEPKTARKADAEELYAAWRIDAPSAREAEIFAPAFFDEESVGEESALGRRSATVQCVLGIVKAARGGLDEDQIRAGIAQQRLPGGRVVKFRSAAQPAASAWLVLQIRQAQRAALEGLLGWLEWRLDTLRDIDRIRSELRSVLGHDGTRGTGRALDDFKRKYGSLDRYLTACADGSADCLFRLREQLIDGFSNDSDVAVRIGSRILLVCVALTEWLRDENQEAVVLLDYGRVERVSLSHQQTHFRNRSGSQFSEWICDVLEGWVIGQHLAVATRRFVGGKTRLRFTIDEGGFQFLAEKRTAPFVSPDHLATSLSLMCDCRLLNYDYDKEVYVSVDA